jgi:hypothetical protein
MTRQLDYPPVNAPIPGSTRDRVQRQAAKVLELPVRVPVSDEPKRPQASKAWGDVASSTGYALALTLRSKPLRWVVRVLMLVLWFVCPLWVSGVITLLAMGWVFMGLRKGFKWLVSKAPKKEPLDTCQCGH